MYTYENKRKINFKKQKKNRKKSGGTRHVFAKNYSKKPKLTVK